MQQDQETLIILAVNGSDEALAKLMVSFTGLIRSKAARFLISEGFPHTENIDIVADRTVEKAFHLIKSGSYEHESMPSFKSWLSIVAINQARDRVKHLRTKKSKAIEPVDFAFKYQTPEPEKQGKPESFADKGESLYRLLSVLEDNERQAILLRYFTDASWSSVSEAMNLVSSDAAKQLGHRARKKIERYIAGELDGNS